MNCLDRAISFGVDPKELESSNTHCTDLPCFKDCPIIDLYKNDPVCSKCEGKQCHLCDYYSKIAGE